jgi:hypothetical protein
VQRIAEFRKTKTRKAAELRGTGNGREEGKRKITGRATAPAFQEDKEQCAGRWDSWLKEYGEKWAKRRNGKKCHRRREKMGINRQNAKGKSDGNTAKGIQPEG